MNSREIAELTGKRHDNVMADIRHMLNELGKDHLTFQGIYLDSMNRKQVEYHLDRELTETLVTGYSIPLRHKVIQRLHQMEAKLAQPIAMPSYAESLRLLADQIEETARVTVERDLAVATKALIGSKREATAMATASAAKREAIKLAQELGRGALHATIIAVEKASGHKFGSQGYRPLQKWCKANGVTPVKVPCPRYGEAVSWPARAWSDCYDVSLADLFGEVAA